MRNRTSRQAFAKSLRKSSSRESQRYSNFCAFSQRPESFVQTQISFPAAVHRPAEIRLRNTTRLQSLARRNSRRASIGNARNRSAKRHATIGDRRVERFGYAFDPFGGLAKRGGNRSLRRLVAIRNRDLGILQSRQLFFQPLDSLPGLGEFVSNGDCRHYRQPGVADLAEFGAQSIDTIIELAR